MRLEPGFQVVLAVASLLGGCGTLRATEGKCVAEPLDSEWVSWRVCAAPRGDWKACGCLGVSEDVLLGGK